MIGCKIYFDIFNSLRVYYECDMQTDRQIDGRTDGQTERPIAIARFNIVRGALEMTIPSVANVQMKLYVAETDVE